MSIFNGLGRLSWASFSDYLGRANTYTLFFAVQIVAFWLLPDIHSIILFQVVLYMILTFYGGGFAALPAYIGDLFGTKELGAIHGYLLTSWAMAGVFGPMRRKWGTVQRQLDYCVPIGGKQATAKPKQGHHP